MRQLNRRRFCRTLAALPAGLNAAPEVALPNIVYALADDLGWGDLDCYNTESAVPTPNANRLATQGMRFTDMHSPSAVCTPTRYGILTGRCCWRSSLKSGVLWGYSPNPIEPGGMTVPSMLKSRGYYTAGIGKWHLGLGDQEKTDYDQPLYRILPITVSIITSEFPHHSTWIRICILKTTVWWKGRHRIPTARTTPWRGGGMAPHFRIEDVLPTLTDHATKLIHERADKPSQPFFLHLALTAPHTPWVPKPDFQGRSKAGIYGDFVAQVDDALWRVLQALDETKLAENTLVIFTSDNGADWKPEDKAVYAQRANANWRGEKAYIGDAGHRISVSCTLAW